MVKIADPASGRLWCNRGCLVAIVALLVIISDQWLKIWVKTHFFIGESYEILPWFELKFIENNGMAFGIELWSKLLLTFFRIIAVIFLCIGMCKLHSCRNLRMGFLICLALVTAGAAGNIFDCVFYGEIFNNPFPPEVASLFPEGGGYAGWFEGRVVDMLYFPFFSFDFPVWMPFVGGQEFEFFQYVFNIADSAICVGVFMMILFYSNDFHMALNILRGVMDKNGEDTEKKTA